MGKLESVAMAATWALANVLALLVLFDPVPSEMAVPPTLDSVVYANGRS